MTLHQRRTHPTPVDGCFACHVGSVAIAASANPSTSGGARALEIKNREARWNADMPAYKRLRRQGLQPKQIDGCHRLETTATSAAQVEGRPEDRHVEMAREVTG